MRLNTEALPFGLLGFLLQWFWTQEPGKGSVPPNVSRSILPPSLLGSGLQQVDLGGWALGLPCPLPIGPGQWEALAGYWWAGGKQGQGISALLSVCLGTIPTAPDGVTSSTFPLSLGLGNLTPLLDPHGNDFLPLPPPGSPSITCFLSPAHLSVVASSLKSLHLNLRDKFCFLQGS